MAVPVWLLGKHVTAFTLVPQTNTNGTLSAGSSTNIAGTWDEIDITSEPETEEISSADASRQNHVVLKNNTRFRCTGLLKYNGVNQPAAILSANDYFQMNVTRGGQTWTGYFIRGNYTEAIRKGRSTWTVEFMFADNGAEMGYS